MAVWVEDESDIKGRRIWGFWTVPAKRVAVSQV